MLFVIPLYAKSPRILYFPAQYPRPALLVAPTRTNAHGSRVFGLGPVPGTINPLQEVNAKLSAIKGGLSLRSSEAFQSNGGEYADFMEQWEQEESQYQKMYPDAQANKLAESFESGESSKPVPDEDAEDKPEETDDKESKKRGGRRMKTIELSGDIGWEITAKSIRSQLVMNSREAVRVKINSYGGDVFEAFQIYNLFHDYPR